MANKFADGWTRTPDRARAVLDVVTAVCADGDLERALQLVVQSACELTGARYGALGALGPGSDELARFVVHGLDEHAHAAIGESPLGEGVLGLFRESADPIRLDEVSRHPESVGFPAHHPPMRTFLGAPVRAGETLLGNLYLAEKAGGQPFTAADESLVVALAAVAGAVIDNARAHAVGERQQRWLEACSVLTSSAEGAQGIEEVLAGIAEAICWGAEAIAVRVFARDASGADLVASAGLGREDLPAVVERLASEIARAANGENVEPVPVGGHRTALVMPLGAQLVERALLVILVDREATITAPVIPGDELIEPFVHRAALTLDRAQALTEREAMAMLSERDRIARDLHDVVIQRLFATGLLLKGVGETDREVAERVGLATIELDSTIHDLRNTIFELGHRRGSSFRGGLLALVREYAAILDFTPRLRTEGPLDTVVGDRTKEYALTVLREALSNAVRHAQASRVEIVVSADAAELVVRVLDDGCGLPRRRRESGLANIRRRGKELDGQLSLTAARPHGTLLIWRVPLTPP